MFVSVEEGFEMNENVEVEGFELVGKFAWRVLVAANKARKGAGRETGSAQRIKPEQTPWGDVTRPAIAQGREATPARME